jgi:hypothetical protein
MVSQLYYANFDFTEEVAKSIMQRDGLMIHPRPNGTYRIVFYGMDRRQAEEAVNSMMGISEGLRAAAQDLKRYLDEEKSPNP